MSDDQPSASGPPSDAAGPDERREEPRHVPPERQAWAQQVRFAVGPGGEHVAYRPGEVLSNRPDDVLEVVNALFGDNEVRQVDAVGPFGRFEGVPDAVLLVQELRLRDFKAQLNYVYFSHGVTSDPVHPSPVHPSPVHPSPVHPSPVHPSPVHPSASGYAVYPGFFTPGPFDQIPPSDALPRESCCRPAPPETPTQDLFHRISAPPAADSPEVIVLDTGLAAPAYLPAALQGGGVTPAAVPRDLDEPDADHNHFLDPVAGHGTFIAGVIAQIAPGCTITVHQVLSGLGICHEWDIVTRLDEVAGTLAVPQRALLNLSFGGEVLDYPDAMAWAIRALQVQGVTVVASAGNDSTWRPQYPAVLPGVIGVGAVGPTGPAWFTNYGPWVDACAPGVDLVSTFFTNWNGDAPKGRDGLDPDDYHGWAIWSGTSFSAPVVVGNLARLMMLGDSAHQAVQRLIGAPALTRLPYLGTVVDAL